MNRRELKALNMDLIQLLQSVRDQIDGTLEELEALACDCGCALEMFALLDTEDGTDGAFAGFELSRAG